MIVLSTMVTVGTSFIGAFAPRTDAGKAAQGVFTAFTIAFWIATAISTIPMIVSSVVAHQNRAPCSCSTRSTDYVD